MSGERIFRARPVADRFGGLERGLRIRRRRPRLDGRDPVGLQQGLRLELVEHLAARRENLFDQPARRHRVGRGGFTRGRRLEQERLVAPVRRQQRECPHRLFGRRVVGRAGLGEDPARVGNRGIAEPARHDPARCRAHERRAGPRDGVAAHDRGRRVDEEHRAASRSASSACKVAT
jgi:hypothetical protein